MEKIAFKLYLASIVIGVLSFGAIHTWAYTLVFLGIFAASLLLLRGFVVRDVPPSSLPAGGRNGEARADEVGGEQGEVGPHVVRRRRASSSSGSSGTAVSVGERRDGRTGWRFRWAGIWRHDPNSRNSGSCPRIPERKFGHGRHLRWIKTDLAPLFLCFLALLILQMIPMPQWLLSLLSPTAKIAAEMSQPVTPYPPALPGAWSAPAPYLYPVRMSLIRWVAYGLLFFGLIRCLNSRKRIETAIVVLILLGCFDTLYGIMQTYSGHGHVWWFKSNVYGKDVSGTFLSRNLFAGFLEMTITLAVAYAAALIEGGKTEHAGSGSAWRRRSLKKRFLAFFSENAQNHKRILIIFAGGVMGLGLILSSSRGGIMAMAATLLLMGIVFYFRKGERRKGRIILLLFGITVIFALHAGIDYTVGRFHFFDEAVKERGIMAEKTLNLFKDYKIAGVGVGNFRHAYGKYQDPVHKNLYMDYAHNDYAQFLAEVGIVGVILLLAGLGWYVVRTFRFWRERHDPFAVYLGMAPFAALFAVAIHSFSDYNLHRPAHMMVLVAVVAIGYAALHLERGRHFRTRYPVRLIPLRPWGSFLLAGVVGMILWSGLWTIRHFIAETYCNTDTNITLNLDQNPPPDRLRKAISWNSGNAVYHYKLSQAMMAERDRRLLGPGRDREGWKRSHDKIIAEIVRAIHLNPWNAEYHVRLGWEYSYLYDRPDHQTRWMPAADVCMNRAAWFAGSWPVNPRLQYDMGNYWTMRSKTLPPNDPSSKIAWTKAVWHYRQGMALEKRWKLPEDVRAYLANFFWNEAALFRSFWLFPAGVSDNMQIVFENVNK